MSLFVYLLIACTVPDHFVDCEGHLSFITSGIEQVYNALVPILKSQALVLRLPSYPLHPLAAALFTSLWPRTS